MQLLQVVIFPVLPTLAITSAGNISGVGNIIWCYQQHHNHSRLLYHQLLEQWCGLQWPTLLRQGMLLRHTMLVAVAN